MAGSRCVESLPLLPRQLPFVAALGLLAYVFWASAALTGIAAGVAIFLFGMMTLERGFKALTGGVLEMLLRRSTDRFWKGLTFGAATTALTQSSSLVSVITISFLSAGLLTLGQGIGVIFGANLGTTTGAWLMAGPGMRFNIGLWALPMLTFGVVFVLARSDNFRSVGWVLAGVGFLFLGIQWMKEGFEAFHQAVDLSRYAVGGLAGMIIYTLAGVTATVIMQSSHAALIVTITALSAGQITYENALAISIGANIGTTVTALIAAFAANVEGRRLAGAHLVFNLTTAAVALVFIGQFMLAVDWLSQRMGIAPDSYALRLALFHTMFNITGIAIMVPLIPRMVLLLERFLRSPRLVVSQPRFINPTMTGLPGAALEAVRRELLRLFRRVFSLIAQVLNFDTRELQQQVDDERLRRLPVRIEAPNVDDIYNTRVKPLHGLIVDFLAHVPVQNKRAEQAAQLRAACRHLVEAVKDAKHLQKNLVRHLRSSNPALRGEYAAIRAGLGRLLHQLDELLNIDDPETAGAGIDALESQVDAGDIVRTGRLDELIRERRISSENATSLMNDSAYANRIARNLLAMARVTFRPLSTEDEPSGDTVLDGQPASEPPEPGATGH
ncbi:MAG: Na/Pi symporter [Gammaproteobacteria bacterium]|nr:Na/Pi symporter [Gammaproteobacteria bacterium]